MPRSSEGDLFGLAGDQKYPPGSARDGVLCCLSREMNKSVWKVGVLTRQVGKRTRIGTFLDELTFRHLGHLGPMLSYFVCPSLVGGVGIFGLW